MPMEISARFDGGRGGYIRVEQAVGHSSSHFFKVQIKNPFTHLLYKKPKTIKIQCKQQAHVNKSFLEILKSIPEWADEIKERGMQQSKSLYTHDDWVRHRSSTRHIRHVMSSLSSRVILSLIPPVCIFTAIAVVISAYNTAVTCEWFPAFLPLLHASSLPYQLTAPALALLLVFRTEASYQRYDEGRKTWTKVISSAKDFARQTSAWIQHPHDSPLKNDLLVYIMAFPVALKCYVVYGSDMGHELGSLLEEADLAVVLSSQHRPYCIIQFMSETLRKAHLDESKRSILDSHISQFSESICVCERLIGTPIPLSYTRLTSRFLVLWHITLPIVLWDHCNWIVVPATFISAASLFCIEEVGVLIEEPFPMLALDNMCALAHENIREMVKLQSLVEDHMHGKRASLLDRGVSNGTGRRNRETNLKL